MELNWGFSADGDEEDEPGSGDEDVLASLGASYRAWRVYHREKRAHDYTKSRLVSAFRRETALEKQLTRLGGSIEGIECMLMKMEDLEARMVENYEDHHVSESEFKVLEERVVLCVDQLNEAEAAKAHWKEQYEQLLSKMVVINREKQQLAGDLRNVKKTAVLMANRQYLQLGANDPIQRTEKNDKRVSKKRSYNSLKIGQSML